jgi:hypothetical protein
MKLDLKPKINICEIVNPLYYSGFCLTDNKNFCEFYVKKFPKLNQDFRSFFFDENNLKFKLGNEVEPEELKKNVLFNDFSLDNKVFFVYFVSKYKGIKFFWLERWLEKNRSGLIGIVDLQNKLVGLLKTKKRRTKDGSKTNEEGKGKREASSKEDVI